MAMTPEALLAELPRAGDGPVFAEPWQARIFAVVARLCEEGHYPWDDFKALLIDEIAHHGAADGHDYYACWLAACERLVTQRGFVAADELAARKAHLAAHPPHQTHAAPGPVAVDPARRA